MSPNRVCEDYTYDTVDVFPVFQISPDATEYLPATSPVTPPDSERLPTSPNPPDPDCLPPGATGLYDCIIDWQSLIKQATDLSRPLIPLLDDLILLPMSVPIPPSPSPGHSSQKVSLTQVVSAPVDLSREGPFGAFCVPSDTWGHPLIVEGLPGCPYRMTSYREEDIAEVDPTFGVQLHHPHFLECIGVSSLLGSVSGRVDPYDGQAGRYIGSLTATA